MICWAIMNHHQQHHHTNTGRGKTRITKSASNLCQWPCFGNGTFCAIIWSERTECWKKSRRFEAYEHNSCVHYVPRCVWMVWLWCMMEDMPHHFKIYEVIVKPDGRLNWNVHFARPMCMHSWIIQKSFRLSFSKWARRWFGSK